MSVDVFVFIGEASLPSRTRWQAGLDALGVALQLGDIGDVTSHTGYWPVTIHGSTSGFELYTGSVEHAFGRPAPSGAGDRELVVDLVTGGDMQELLCSLYAASALAYVADGVCYDEETDSAVPYGVFLDQARLLDNS